MEIFPRTKSCTSSKPKSISIAISTAFLFLYTDGSLAAVVQVDKTRPALSDSDNDIDFDNNPNCLVLAIPGHVLEQIEQSAKIKIKIIFGLCRLLLVDVDGLL